MLYFLMFITALILTNVFKWNLIVAALTACVGWAVVGGILRAIVGASSRVQSGESKSER